MAVSVKDIRDLADQIAQKADEAERAYQACEEAYARYETLKQDVRQLTGQFNGLAQQLTAPTAAAEHASPAMSTDAAAKT